MVKRKKWAVSDPLSQYMAGLRKIGTVSEWQIRAWLVMAKKKDQEAIKRIVEAMMPLSVHIAGARSLLHPQSELIDLAQDGVLGIYKAIEKFDLKRNVKFKTYAYWWIRQVIDRANHPSRVVLHKSHSDAVSRELNPVKNVIARESEDLTKQKAKKLLSQLPPRERQVIALRFGFLGEPPRTLQEIGDILNLSRERIRQIELEAMNNLKEFCASHYPMG